jgi:hypothetical protein
MAAWAIDLEDVLLEPMFWTDRHEQMHLGLVAMFVTPADPDVEPDRRRKLQRAYSAACRVIRFLEGRARAS